MIICTCSSLSGLVCSCQNPITWPSSWTTIPNLSQFLPIEIACSPLPLLPTKEQHLNKENILNYRQIWHIHLMCAADKIWITKKTLANKNIRSVCHSHAQVYRSIWCKANYDVTDKNIKVSSKGLDRHNLKYSSSLYQTRW